MLHNILFYTNNTDSSSDKLCVSDDQGFLCNSAVQCMRTFLYSVHERVHLSYWSRMFPPHHNHKFNNARYQQFF